MSDDNSDIDGSDEVEIDGTSGFSTNLEKADLDDEESNQGLFDDLLSGEPIFENKEVLRPSYTPHELPHRSDQINKMATILVAALRAKRRRTSSSTGRPGPAKPQARNSSARNSRAPRRSTASRVTSSTSTARSPIRSIAYSHNSRTSSSKRTKSGSTNALRNSNRCSRPSTSTMPIWRPANVRRPKRPSRPIWQTIRRRPIRSISFLTTRKNRLLTIHLETIVAPSRSILHPKRGSSDPADRSSPTPPTALI